MPHVSMPDVSSEQGVYRFEEPFSIVIPAYNEEAGIQAVIEHIHQSLSGLDCQYEVIIVDDGSTDSTVDILKQQPNITLIQHRVNQGYGAALKTGIRSAKSPLIVITDADGTYPNHQIPQLVALAAQADMVVGARLGQNVQYPLIRKLPKYFLVHFAQWIAHSPIPDLNSGLRVFRKDVVERFLTILPDTFSFTTTITLAMLTNKYIVQYHPIDYYQRQGKSKIKPIRDTLNFLQLILRVGVYFAPLRIFLPIAGVFFIGFLITLSQDVFVRNDLTDRTLILLVTATQVTMFALLADMIDKRI